MKRFYVFCTLFFMLIFSVLAQESADGLENTEDVQVEDKIVFTQEDLENNSENSKNPENPEDSKKGYGYYFWEELKSQFQVAIDGEVPVLRLCTFGPILMTNEFKTTGLGFSFEYEHQIIPHISLKDRTRFTTFLTGYSDLVCLTMYTSLFAEYYPMSRQLRKLYVGIGGSVEGFIYVNGKENIEGSDERGWVFAVTPEVGYKMTAGLGIIIDMYIGYKWTYPINTVFYGSTKDFFGDNLVYGFNIHIPIDFKKLFVNPYHKTHTNSDGAETDKNI